MDIAGLYGKVIASDAEAAKAKEQRFRSLTEKHRELFGEKPEAVFSASGRTELGGNHTDHNLGKVLAGAVNLDTVAAVHRTSDNRVSFISEGHHPVDTDIGNPVVDSKLFGTSTALVNGVAAAIMRRGGKAGGFRANISSTVMKGSGLSSSAALEVLLGTVFNSLYNNDRFTTTELAMIGQEAENLYFGKPSGLMDQIACANGGIVAIDFKDPLTPEITPVETDFADYGYNLVITSTGGSHADMTDDYASIPSEMKTVASFFGKNSLREVDWNVFSENIGEVRKAVGNDRALMRAFHYFEENSRVDAMVHALKTGNFRTYLDLVAQSGNSSFKYLQNIYSPRDFRSQGIALAYAATETFLKGEGAVRVQGGGFAGTVEAYIPCDRTEDYFNLMEKMFTEGCCTVLSIRKLPAMRVM